MDKYDLLSKNDKNQTYLAKIHDHYTSKAKKKKDVLLEDFPYRPTLVDMGLKQIEIMGLMFEKPFASWEGLRCLKCNFDILQLENILTDNNPNDDIRLFAIPTKIESKVSKTGNKYNKLSLSDEYHNMSILVWEKTYDKFYSEINGHDPLIIQLKKSTTGSITLNYCKRLERLEDMQIYNICFVGDWQDERIISKFMMDYIGGETKFIFNHKVPKFKVKIDWGVIRSLKSEGFKFELNKEISLNTNFSGDISEEELRELVNLDREHDGMIYC